MSDLPIAPRTNFGGNLALTPCAFYVPADETELLAIVQKHRGEEIRAVGRLHCWGESLSVAGVMVDLRRFDQISIHTEQGPPFAEVGAGCQVKHLLAVLRSHGYTTRSQGLITEQTLVGAAATGTHGSGEHSYSHDVLAVRVVHDGGESVEPVIDDIVAGDDLLAARCSLGCLGIITRVRIAIRSAYHIEEHFRQHDTLAEVLVKETEYPLQQFFFVPWRWDFFAQHRRETDRRISTTMPLYRLYWSVGMDRLFHVVILLLARLLSPWFTNSFFRYVLAWLVPQGWKVVDRSDRQLSMRHELFRHIETELFVTGGKLTEALRFLKVCLQQAAGESVVLEESLRSRLVEMGLWSQWTGLAGAYLHHYPICIRKVFPDDTLISMSSGDEPRYAISLISYTAVDRRQGFFATTEFLSRAMAKLFGARPHWGKHCPLSAQEIAALYPRWNEFRQIANRFDPQHRFANSWLRPALLKPALPPVASIDETAASCDNIPGDSTDSTVDRT